MFGPSPPCAAATMPSADFCRLILPPLDNSSTWQNGRSPRVLRTHLHPIYLSHILPHLPDDYRASNLYAFSPECGCLLCASCSSGRGFACRFLQTPPRGGSPCGLANGSRHLARRGLSPPSRCALPGAHKKRAVCEKTPLFQLFSNLVYSSTIRGRNRSGQGL
jgi:hypothetical protein